MSTICAIVVGLGLSAAAPAPPDVILPGGMHMPYVNLGTGSGQHGDVSSATKLWIEAGGVGIDVRRLLLRFRSFARCLQPDQRLANTRALRAPLPRLAAMPPAEPPLSTSVSRPFPLPCSAC
jgi:hypothetical protein